MTFSQFLKSSETGLGLRKDLKKIYRVISQRASSITLRRYLRANEVRKLQIGAGSILLPGWLGTDLNPSNHVVCLDATKPFWFDDNTFDYIHSEHMIEHITWFEAHLMLRECFRILKPGGKIRIATPDLEIFIKIYNDNIDQSAKRYIEWVTKEFLGGVHENKASFVINALFYNWGHKFIYDYELLEMVMKESGFNNLSRFSPGESEDEHLKGIEMHGRIGKGNEEMNIFETMVVEGIK